MTAVAGAGSRGPAVVAAAPTASPVQMPRSPNPGLRPVAAWRALHEPVATRALAGQQPSGALATSRSEVNVSMQSTSPVLLERRARSMERDARGHGHGSEAEAQAITASLVQSVEAIETELTKATQSSANGPATPLKDAQNATDNPEAAVHITDLASKLSQEVAMAASRFNELAKMANQWSESVKAAKASAQPQAQTSNAMGSPARGFLEEEEDSNTTCAPESASTMLESPRPSQVAFAADRIGSPQLSPVPSAGSMTASPNSQPSQLLLLSPSPSESLGCPGSSSRSPVVAFEAFQQASGSGHERRFVTSPAAVKDGRLPAFPVTVPWPSQDRCLTTSTLMMPATPPPDTERQAHIMADLQEALAARAEADLRVAAARQRLAESGLQHLVPADQADGTRSQGADRERSMFKSQMEEAQQDLHKREVVAQGRSNAVTGLATWHSQKGAPGRPPLRRSLQGSSSFLPVGASHAGMDGKGQGYNVLPPGP